MGNERKILFFCHSAHFMSHFVMVVFPTLAFWIAGDFDLGIMEAINKGFWMYLLFGLFALPFGYLNDLVGRNRFFLVLFFLGVGASSVALGFSSGVGALQWGLLSMGVFAAIYHPVGMAFLSKSIRRRGSALGFNGIFGTLGIVAAPFAAGWLALHFGWKVAYIVLGLVPIALGISLLFVSFDESVVERPAEKTSYGAAPKWALLGLVMASAFFVGLNYRGMVSVAPVYVKTFAADALAFLGDWTSEKGDFFRWASASFAVSATYSVGLLGQFVGGKLADKVDLKWGYFAFHALTMPGLLLVAIAADHLLLGSLMVVVFFSLGMQPLENSLIASLSPEAWRGRLYGIKFVCILGSSAIALKSVKWAEANYGLRSVFVLNALQLVVVLSLLGWVIVLARGRGNKSKPLASQQAQAVQNN